MRRLRGSNTVVALVLAALPVCAFAGDAARGQEKAVVCGACHGADGNSASPAFPRLAGQHEDYLFEALRAYKSGERKNPIMAAQVEKLSVADMHDLAAWFASRQGVYFKR
jgi:cytochrome c553